MKTTELNLKEDDCLVGVFVIEAESEEEFLNRKEKFREITGFTDDGFDSYEEYEEGGLWKVVTSVFFKNKDEIKKDLKEMENYDWLIEGGSRIVFERQNIWCEGKWLI